MCRDCRVRGGTKKPCWPHPVAKNPHGYPCPRREFPDAESADLSVLVGLGKSGETGHLFRVRWDLAFGDRPRAEQGRLFNRLLAAYGDDLLRLVFWPKVN
jgi:hypothetical protein